MGPLLETDCCSWQRVPDSPLIQSGGLLLQGLTGTSSAYLWTSPAGAAKTDHVYTIDGTASAGYTDEGVVGYVHQNSDSGTVALTRYVNSTTGSHYYANGGSPPGGYVADTTLGYVDSTSAAGLVPLARHFNATTNDYLLDTSVTPPAGYAYQATLGYLRPAAPPSGIVTAYTRNALGQVTQVSRPEVTYTYTYDAAHRLQTVTDSRGSKRLTYTYSPGGRRTSLQDSDGNRTDSTYDPVGRLTGITAPSGDLVTFAHDAGERMSEKTFPNGVNTRYIYNPDNTLARLLNRVGSSESQVISQHDYTYDGVANRITHTERIAATTTRYGYVYDPLDRLLEVRQDPGSSNTLLEAYTYDPLGNRLSKTAGASTTYYTYDGANQVTALCVGTPGCAQNVFYDLNGNVTAGPGTSYAYDAENRLVWASLTGQVEQTYAYDDQGRRLRKTVGNVTTQYLYDGPDIIGEYATWASPTARTTHGPATDDPLLRATATTAQYFHQDGLGSVVALSNPTGGTDGTQRFDVWGNKIASTGSIPVYGYTGREPDETGLIYYRARYYDPTLGRFTQRDPKGLRGGMNLYRYVGNDPVNLKDPNGTEWTVTYLPPQGGVTRIRYELTIAYQGTGITPEIQQRFDEGIRAGARLSSGRIAIETTVKSIIIKDEETHLLAHAHGYHIATVPKGGGDAMARLGGMTMILPAASTSGSIAAHEVIHTLGVDDKYIELPGDFLGRRAAPIQGYESDIMAVRGGTLTEWTGLELHYGYGEIPMNLPSPVFVEPNAPIHFAPPSAYYNLQSAQGGAGNQTLPGVSSLKLPPK